MNNSEQQVDHLEDTHSIPSFLEVMNALKDSASGTDKQLAEDIITLIESEQLEQIVPLLENWSNKSFSWGFCLDLLVNILQNESDTRLKLSAESTANLLPALKAMHLKHFGTAEEQRKREEEILKKWHDEQNYRDENFHYTEEEQAIYEQLEELRHFYLDEEEEGCIRFADYLARLNLSELPPVVITKLNRLVYTASSTAKIYQFDGFEQSDTDDNSEQSDQANQSENEHWGQVIQAYQTTKAYQTWYDQYAPESILQNPDFNLTDLQALCEQIREDDLYFSKDWYQSKQSEGEMKESFEAFLLDSSNYCRYGSAKVASSEVIHEFEQKNGVSFPDELKTFYQTMGHLNYSNYWSLSFDSLNKRQEEIDDPDRSQPLKSLRLMDFIGYMNSYENSYIQSDPNKYGFSQPQLDYLNENYTAIGYVWLSDDIAPFFVYYDKAGKIGMVGYEHDSPMIYEHLETMLEGSPAKYSLAQFMGACVTLAQVGYVSDKSEFYQMVMDMK